MCDCQLSEEENRKCTKSQDNILKICLLLDSISIIKVTK